MRHILKLPKCPQCFVRAASGPGAAGFGRTFSTAPAVASAHAGADADAEAGAEAGVAAGAEAGAAAVADAVEDCGADVSAQPDEEADAKGGAAAAAAGVNLAKRDALGMSVSCGFEKEPGRETDGAGAERPEAAFGGQVKPELEADVEPGGQTAC